MQLHAVYVCVCIMQLLVVCVCVYIMQLHVVSVCVYIMQLHVVSVNICNVCVSGCEIVIGVSSATLIIPMD